MNAANLHTYAVSTFRQAESRVNLAAEKASETTILLVNTHLSKDIRAYKPQVALAFKVAALAVAILALFTAYVAPFYFMLAVASGAAIRLKEATQIHIRALIPFVKQENPLTIIGLSVTAILVVNAVASMTLLSITSGLVLGINLRSLYESRV